MLMGKTLGILRISVGDVYRFYHVFMQYNQYICLNEAPSHWMFIQYPSRDRTEQTSVPIQ